MDFYDDVLREIVLAMGAALFVANAFALYRLVVAIWALASLTSG
jgi:hypothetical protein